MSVLKVAFPLTVIAALLGACSNEDTTAQLRQEVSSLRAQVQQTQQTASAAETEARAANDKATAAQAQANEMYNRSLHK